MAPHMLRIKHVKYKGNVHQQDTLIAIKYDLTDYRIPEENFL